MFEYSDSLSVNLKDESSHICINDMEELRGAIGMISDEAENPEKARSS